jgi:hypothetical protein
MFSLRKLWAAAEHLAGGLTALGDAAYLVAAEVRQRVGVAPTADGAAAPALEAPPSGSADDAGGDGEAAGPAATASRRGRKP